VVRVRSKQPGERYRSGRSVCASADLSWELRFRVVAIVSTPSAGNA
jgi:hypothetical protein